MASISRTFNGKGCVRLYDVRVGKHTADIVPMHLGRERRGPYIEGLAINPIDPNYFLVGDDNCVQMFDMRNLGNEPITKYLSPFQKFGFTSCSDIKFLPDGSRFVVCYQNFFPALYSIHSGNPSLIFYGSEYTSIFTGRSPDVAEWGNYSFVIAGSDKEKICTWMVPANLSLPEGGGEGASSLDGTFSGWNNGNRVQMARKASPDYLIMPSGN